MNEEIQKNNASGNGDIDPINIVDYQPGHQQFFESLNPKWIEKHFEMEPLDVFVLTNPEEAILKPGGAILMAMYKTIVAGTVALRKIDANTFEFTKMAVDENFRRKGIAEAMTHASFEKAKQLGAKTLILYSNSILKPAIILYEKIGFKHLPVSAAEYKRSDVKMMIEL